jgi:hypothetical protein
MAKPVKDCGTGKYDLTRFEIPGLTIPEEPFRKTLIMCNPMLIKISVVSLLSNLGDYLFLFIEKYRSSLDGVRVSKVEAQKNCRSCQ